MEVESVLSNKVSVKSPQQSAVSEHPRGAGKMNETGLNRKYNEFTTCWTLLTLHAMEQYVQFPSGRRPAGPLELAALLRGGKKKKKEKKTYVTPEVIPLVKRLVTALCGFVSAAVQGGRSE